jgi:hypothetical protein
MISIAVAMRGLATSSHTLLACLSLLRRLMNSQQRGFSLTVTIAVMTNDWLSVVKDRSWLGEHLGYWMMAKAMNLYLLFYQPLFCFLASLWFLTLQS